jgi:hypothetical protein
MRFMHPPWVFVPSSWCDQSVQATSSTSASAGSRRRHVFILIVRLIEEEVGGHLFVLFASEISLNYMVPRKPESAQTFDGVSFLFSHGNLSGARRCFIGVL